MRLSWSLNRSRHGRDRRFMKNDLDTVERFLKHLLIGDTAFDEIDITADLFKVLTMAR
jgi:hypothetical protein